MAVQLIARRRVTYASRVLRPGDTFEASPKDALILTAIGAAEAKEPEPEPIPFRDGSLAEPLAPLAEEEAPSRRQRRQYRRRDMIAEGDDE